MIVAVSSHCHAAAQREIGSASLPNHGWYIVLPRPLLIDAGWRLALLGGILAGIALALASAAGLGGRAVAGALIAYAAIVGLVVMGIGQHRPHRRFGLANTLTLSRGADVALLVGIIADGTSLSETGRSTCRQPASTAGRREKRAIRRTRRPLRHGGRRAVRARAVGAGLARRTGGPWVLTIGRCAISMSLRVDMAGAGARRRGQASAAR